MPASPNHWYVQTDFGALLGPMPEDALFEMARTGALLKHDHVREGCDGEWLSAEGVTGLFDAAPKVDITTTHSGASTFADMFNSRLDRRAASLPRSNVSSLAEQVIEEQLEVVVAEAAAKEKHDNSIDLTEELEVSQPQIPATSDFVELEQDEPKPQESASTVPVSPSPAYRQISTPPLKEGRNRRGRNWSTILVSLSVPLIAAVGWWFWPSQQRDLSSNYVAIYHEWQERRENIHDQVGWNEFVSRAKSQLEQSIPWLEQNAVPGRGDLSLLLYVGRDLLEILDRPPSSKVLHQMRLKYFVDQLQNKSETSKKTE